MKEIIATQKFKRSFRKFVKRNAQLEQKIIETLKLMQEDIFAPQLATHSLQGKLLGLKACSCGYDCRIGFIKLKFLPPPTLSKRRKLFLRLWVRGWNSTVLTFLRVLSVGWIAIAGTYS